MKGTEPHIESEYVLDDVLKNDNKGSDVDENDDKNDGKLSDGNILYDNSSGNNEIDEGIVNEEDKGNDLIDNSSD